MDDMDKKAIGRVVDRMTRTGTIAPESKDEVFKFLGIAKNVRKSKQSIKTTAKCPTP